MGCLRRLGCFVVVLVAVVLAWLLRDQWTPYVRRALDRPVEHAAAPAPTWESLTPEGAARAKAAVEKLGKRSGPVFANLSPGDLTAYVLTELSRQLPPSADHIEAAAFDRRLHLRADVDIRDLGDTRSLGPLAGVLGDRAQVQLGGTLEVVHPGLAEYRVESLRLHDLSIPTPMIPRILERLARGARPSGVADDALPLTVPPYIGDVRIHDGKITLYKVVT
jgi:hypothetical protein